MEMKPEFEVIYRRRTTLIRFVKFKCIVQADFGLKYRYIFGTADAVVVGGSGGGVAIDMIFLGPDCT